jgi:hypothetical protein
VADFASSAKRIGFDPWPWQVTAARYVYALGPGDQWLYPEVAIVVSRQNGKTEFLLPHILERLREGRRILHVAQRRDLPRMLYVRLIPLVLHEYGFKVKIRKSSGQETIELDNGGLYKIAAATPGASRGMTIDDLLLDEVRELKEDFIGAVMPTMIARPNPQVLYLSNAGDETTRVLNSIRDRADEDPSLAYLEWSAPPDLAVDDPAGWVHANPAIGHRPGLIDNLARIYRSNKLAGTLAAFETEYLCRWVTTLRERLVDEYDWVNCRADDGLGAPRKPAYAVSMDPSGTRATLAQAWMVDTHICLRIVRQDIGSPVDLDAIGQEIKRVSAVSSVGYDPLTDAELVKYAREGKAVSISGGKFSNASAQFVNAITARKLAWSEADAVSDDLTWTARKIDSQAMGSYQAVRAKDDHPVTAALAAIRAVWLASGPKSAGKLVMR